MKQYILGIVALIGAVSFGSILYTVSNQVYAHQQQPYSTYLTVPIKDSLMSLEMDFMTKAKTLSIDVLMDGQKQYSATLIPNSTKKLSGYFYYQLNETFKVRKPILGEVMKQILLNTSSEIVDHPDNHKPDPVETKRRLDAANATVTSSETLFSTIPPFIYLSHILVLVAALTNSFQMLLPIIEFSEMVYFLGFYNILKGSNLNSFYAKLNQGTIDPYYYLRNSVNLAANTAAGVPAPVLNAGLNQSILVNLMPDIVILSVFTFLYVLTKVLTAVINNETLRKINYAFKSVWLGVFYVQSWRFCFFAGLQARFVDMSTSSGVMELIIMALAFVFVVIYPIKLLFEIKSVVANVGDQDLMHSVGLLHNMDSNKNFDFDCLNYSNLYFPLMNYFRHFIFFICLGVAFDITKVQIGGTIVSLLLYFTILLNQPPMKSRQRNITLLLSNALVLFMVCGLISVDISETIYHTEVSQLISTYCVIMYLVGLLIHFLSILASVATTLIEAHKEAKKKKNQEVCKEEVLQLGYTDYAKSEKRTERAKPIKKTKNVSHKDGINTKVDDKVSMASSEDEDDFSQQIVTKPKITKTRKGRII